MTRYKLQTSSNENISCWNYPNTDTVGYSTNKNFTVESHHEDITS